MSSYLIHYGVPGQKHGNRKYQYEDGSLTPEGKIHYGVGDGRKSKTKTIFKPGDKPGEKVKKTAKAVKEDFKHDVKSKKGKDEKSADAKKQNAKATAAVAGIIALGTAASIAVGLIATHKSDKISGIKKTPVIDADDWETIGKLKLKDIGADKDYYNGDSYRYKSKY